MLRIGTAKYLVGIVIRIGGVIVRRAFLLGFLFLALSTINAFPLVFDNYKLTSVIPEGKIVGDRSYEDRTIRINFGDFTGNYPEFTLKNISSKPLTIIWDLCAFIDSEGRSDSVLRKGIPFQNRGNSIPSTIVIPGAYVDEIMVPIGSIQYIDGEWKATNSIPRKAEMTISLVLTVEQQGEQTTYIFGFESVLGSGGVLVEHGSFIMGDTWGEGDSDESPPHKVMITSDFYIGKFEVTFDEYDVFCEATSRDKPSDEGWGRGARPVINVSWWDAIAYCNWLSEKEKLPKAYDDKGNFLNKDGDITTDPSKVVGYRLPTEAEWEYAAKGGNKSEGYKYSGSNNLDDVAWYWQNSGDNNLTGVWNAGTIVKNNCRTQKVGYKAPNGLGLYDMSGNVAEWCSDFYDEEFYKRISPINAYNSDSGELRVVRGGDWFLLEGSLRAERRLSYIPSTESYRFGFRICRNATYEGGNRPPLEPYNPEVSYLETDDLASVCLSWDCIDPDSDMITYYVLWGTNRYPEKSVEVDQAEKTAIVDYLSCGTTYFWRVIVEDSQGARTEGPVWSFYTPVKLSSYSPSETVPSSIKVEKGSFIMGDNWGDGEKDEKPTHKVTFTYDFHIGEYEVTFDEYDTFCEATGKTKPTDSDWGRGSRPVINITWWDAIAYCNWLSEKEKLPKAYNSEGNLLDKYGSLTTNPSEVIGYRLPTEAEWEYAARGGNKSEGYKYSGSNDFDEVAWHKDNSEDKTHKVGTKAPNELGIYDMSGNVWEWCSDTWYEYTEAQIINPYSTSSSDQIGRGGCWANESRYLRMAYRFKRSRSFAFNFLGFRICRTEPYEGENRVPLEPYNPRPSHNGFSSLTSVTLEWDSYDPDGDTMTYCVYFDTSTTLRKTLVDNKTDSSALANGLSFGTTYYWKVVVEDSEGATTEGPVWSFITYADILLYNPSSTVPALVLVEKGSFPMGDTRGEGGSDESPPHKVMITSDFYIGKFEVTFNEYDAFCEATGKSKPSDEGWGRESRPVINVSWWDAIAYCNWLSEKEKLPKAYDSDGNLLDKDGRITIDPSKVVGYRLPTEAEWEYTARGGNKSKGYKYSGSDNVGDVAWYDSNSGSKTQKVGGKTPNELGLYDMSGNVWEWCSDWYGNYSSSAQTNPYNSTVGSDRVYRGGCWGNIAACVRVAYRGSRPPTDTYYYLGFRICRTVP